MRKLNAHARIEIALVTALLLGSCSSDDIEYQFTDAERDEISDVAGNVAYDIVLEHEKVIELENRVAEIESKLGM